MPLPRSGRGRRGAGAVAANHQPTPLHGRGGAGAVAANPQPSPLRGLGSSANALPTHRRGRRSHADPTPTRCRDRDRRLFDDSLRLSRSSAVHFDVPVAGGREVISVGCHGERTVRCRYGPVIFVVLGSDGMYSTESVRGRFESIDQLMHAFGASWPSPCNVGTPSEEEQHVGSSASAQTPHPDGLQHLVFSCLPCKEQHVAEPASAQTLHKLDALSLKDLRYTTTMEGSSTTATSLPSLHDTIEALPPSGCCLSSSPIWKRREFDWAITFHTIKDLGGYFRTFPHVGGPFQSKDEADKAIDRYLTDPKNLTTHYYPYGTKKRLEAGQVIDKRHDANYQLAQAVVYKYNDHHNLSGDLAYEVKDVLDEPSLWGEEDSRVYIHINFTAKTKGSDGFDTGSDNLFFAEVTHMRGDAAASAVNCCCMVKPFDNGLCFGCGTTMKHPNNGNPYTGGRTRALYKPFGSGPVIACRVYDEDIRISVYFPAS